MNFLDARISTDDQCVEIPGDVRLALNDGRMLSQGGKKVTIGIRPEHFELTDDGADTIQLVVDHVELLGADTLVYGRFSKDKNLLTIRLPDIHHFERKTVLSFTVSPEKIHIFDRETGHRI